MAADEPVAPARPVEDRPLAAEQLQGEPPEIVPDPPAAELLGVTVPEPFAPEWDGRHIVAGPDDHVLINLGMGIDRATLERVRADLERYWPALADRVLIIGAETVTVIEA